MYKDSVLNTDMLVRDKEIGMTMIMNDFSISRESQLHKAVPSDTTKQNHASVEKKQSETTSTEVERWTIAEVGWGSIEDKVRKAEKVALTKLSAGIDEIFDSKDLKSLTGHTDDEVNTFLATIDEAVANQDYTKAEKLVADFFSKGSDKLQQKLTTVLDSADQAFWDTLEAEFTRKHKLKSEADSIVSGEAIERSLEEVLAKVREGVEKKNVKFQDQKEFKQEVQSYYSSAVNGAKGKLKNAGQNLYTEDAQSVLLSAYSFMKVQCFGDHMLEPEEPQLSSVAGGLTKDQYRQALDGELDDLESKNKFSNRFGRMGKDFIDGLKDELKEEHIVFLDKEKVTVAVGEEGTVAPVRSYKQNFLPNLNLISGPVVLESLIQAQAMSGGKIKEPGVYAPVDKS